MQAFRGRIELGLLRQPLRPDLRPHLLQFLNYALLAALILIAGALGTFTNLPLYASILDLPLSDRISGQQFTVAVQLAALALAALALVPTHRVRPVRNLAVLLQRLLAVSLAPALAPPKAAVAIDLPLQGEWAMIAGGRSTAEPPLQASARAQCPRLRPAGQRPGFVVTPSTRRPGTASVSRCATADGTVVSVRDDQLTSLSARSVRFPARATRSSSTSVEGATSCSSTCSGQRAGTPGPVRHPRAADRRRRRLGGLVRAAPAPADPGPPLARR